MPCESAFITGKNSLLRRARNTSDGLWRSLQGSAVLCQIPMNSRLFTFATNAATSNGFD